MRVGHLGGACLFLALATAIVAAPPAASYPDWPTTPAVPTPMPATVEPSPIGVLPKGVLYVVQHDGDPAQLLVSPPGAASVREFAGSVVVDGVFVDAKVPGESETREYKAKQIFLVKRVAQGQVELLKVPKGLVERRVLSDAVPAPPPKPVDPDVKPVDPPKPLDASPWANAPGLRVMISFQDRDLADAKKVTPQQLSILTGARVRDYLNAKCAKVGNDPQYFIWDHEEDVSAMPKAWQDAHARAKGRLWVVVGNGTKWEERPLPANVDAMLGLLKKYE